MFWSLSKAFIRKSWFYLFWFITQQKIVIGIATTSSYGDEW